MTGQMGSWGVNSFRSFSWFILVVIVIVVSVNINGHIYGNYFGFWAVWGGFFRVVQVR